MQIVIDRDKEVNKLKEMLDTLTDKKDLQSVRFAINILENIDGIPLPSDDVRAFDASVKKLRNHVLTKKEATILYHFKAKSQSVKEIAEEFNMTEYGIEQIIKRAEKKLEVE